MTMDVSSEIEKCVKQLCGEARIFYNASISYIKTLTGEDEFIFVCSEGGNKPTTLCNNKLNLDDSSNNSLNLTGSPLKDSCTFEDLNDIDLLSPTRTKCSTNLQYKIEEQNFLPIKLNKARLIISNLSTNNQIKQQQNCKNSIWILCNGSDNKNTILLRYKFSSTFNQRSIVHYNSIVSVDDLNISEMIALHLQEFGNKTNVKVNTNFECIFNISLYSNLKVIWKSSTLNPTLNNFKNSDITLYQNIEIGKPSLIMEDLWNQLLNLNTLKNNILNFHMVQDKDEMFYYDGKYTDLDSIREKILSILTDVSELQEDEIRINSHEIEIIIKSVKNRPDLDVTDQLWEVLKCCSNYNDLKSAINFIFFCAAKCNIVNMPTNQNCLAELIRLISQRRLAVPCLNATEPLELLLEIGLEKISKDYEYIFSMSKIYSACQLITNNLNGNFNSTIDNLEKNARKSLFSAKHKSTSNNNVSLFKNISLSNNFNNDDDLTTIDGFQNSRFNRNDVEMKLSKLIQCHLILEHLLLIQIYLNLENGNVYDTFTEQLLRKPLKSFENVLRNSIDKIEISIAFDDISNFLTHKTPEIRKITMKSQNNLKEIQNTFYFNKDDIFPPEIFPEIQIDGKEFTKKNIYHHWRYVDIKSKIY